MTEDSLTVLSGAKLMGSFKASRGLRPDSHVEALIPVRVQCLLDDTRSVGLLCIDGDDGERVWQTKDLALGQAIGRDDCTSLSLGEP